MSEAPYELEEVLQRLLAEHPDLLGGDQMRPTDPRRWLLVTREAGIPDAEGGANRWSVDHLFVDQDAVPTLIEVKRSSDTRIRREVVGQMLDYAANVVAHWPPGVIRALFEARVRDEGGDPDEVLRSFFGEHSSDGTDEVDAIDAFWTRAGENLALRQMRLIFVADVIPRELQRIVEFLNQSMARIEVLAIEVRQYLGVGHRILVPRVIGNTAAAEETKQPSSGPRPVRRNWTLEEFRDAVSDGGGPDALAVLDAGLAWAERHNGSVVMGHGKYGPLYPMVPDRGGVPVKVISISTGGSVEIEYVAIADHPPFDATDQRVELNRRFNGIPGVSIDADKAIRAGWPSVGLDVLRSSINLRAFFGVLDDVADRLSRTEPASG